MAAAMDGLDALVFTGGVGEHAPADPVPGRARLPRRRRRRAAQPGRRPATPTSPRPARGVATLVITAREDIEIARQVRTLLR